MRIVDADGHICEPRSVWEEYAEPAFRDRVIQLRRAPDGSDEFFVDGVHRPGGSPASLSIPGGFDRRELSWDDILPGSFDPAARLRVLDEEGIDQAVFFPTIYLVWGDIRDPATAAATCRAYNSWLADFCRHRPDRLYGVGIVPLQDVALAVEETERIAELGLVGVAIRPERFDGLALHDAACDPFWAAVQAHGLVATVHGSLGSRMQSFSRLRYADPFFAHMVCHPFEQMATCLDIVCGGVLERFPELRVGFFESGIGWLPYWLHRMDEHFETMGRVTPWLRKPPSEYFRAQCVISMDPNEGGLVAQALELGLEGCIFWGSDYPHYDCTYPGATKVAEGSCAGLPEEVRAGVLGETARRFYRLD